VSELIFVRHGQASFGAESYDKLSELGIRQIQILADHWHSIGERFDHIYSGELLRQLETANGLLTLVQNDPHHGAPAQAQIHPGLNEYNGGPLIDIYLRDHAAVMDIGAGLESPINDRKLFQQVFEAATAKWIAGELRPTGDDSGFEPWSQFQERVQAAIEEIMQRHSRGSKVLISTSGGVIALALQSVMKLPDSQAIAVNWMVNNSSVTRIRYGGGRASLSLFNGLSHLETPQYREFITFR
jgi:broad specificity phosphatase PhoE